MAAPPEGSAGTGTGRRFVHADPRGSIVAVANYLGNSIATNTYDEYGIPDDSSGNDITTKGRFRYTGQAWIPELEMYYYKARIYSPTLGRFMQTDPIGYEDQFNLYAYVGNDPINGVDFTGLFGCSEGEAGCNISRTENADGSVTVERTETKQVAIDGFYGAAQGDGTRTDTELQGVVVLLPQQSMNGDAANVPSEMEGALLDLSEGLDNTEVKVTSGVRTPEQNRAVRGASQSSHLTTNDYQAADIKIDGFTARETAEAAFESGHFNRSNEYTDGRGTHVDFRPTPNSRRELRRDWKIRKTRPK